MRCIVGSTFNMKADVLRQGKSQTDTTPDPIDDYGVWVEDQDPLTHEIVRVWKPTEITPDDPATPDVNEQSFFSVPCLARGIIDGGIRVAGTTERWGELYENVDYTRFSFPAKYVITKRDRITNIRNNQGQILWKDEETDPFAESIWRATVFDVLGVTPVIDPFGRHTHNVAMLQKAEVYS